MGLAAQACLATGALLLTATAAQAQSGVRRFDLGAGPAAAGWERVGPDQLYGDSAGFGFEPGAVVVGVQRGRDPVTGDFVTSAGPFRFSVACPEGDYRVTVVLGDRTGGSATTVKAEARRLMLEDVRTARGVARRTFVVNVRRPELPAPPANAPGGSTVRLNPRELGSPTWDDKLTLEFVGAAPKVAAIEIEPVTTATRVFLLGDSTVTDQRYEDGASWGQMLPRFLDDQVAVANHAESGETMKSFLTGLRLDKVLSQLRPGDWAFIQFGHNDSKTQWPQTYAEASTTYRSYLRTYIDEVRRRGGHPVLVTSPHRRTFGPDGRITNSHGAYPEAVKSVGRETGVPVVDLHAATAAIYEALGPERSKLAFANGGRDGTHHNNYGAYVLAQGVVQGVRELKLPLARHILADVKLFDPAKPGPPEALTLPASAARSTERPAGS
jgi:lysophospholipase L1-like esterase